MSITFWCPAAPIVEEDVACRLCDGTGIAYWDVTQPCECCNGTGLEHVRRSLLPEINLSNSNAGDFLAHFGAKGDYCGTIPHSNLLDLMVKAKLLSAGVTAAFMEKENVEEERFTRFGRDLDYVMIRGREFLELFTAAHEGGYDVSWG